MKKQAVILYFLLFLCFLGTAQVAINTTGNEPDSSAVLDLQSTTKGMLIPRMDSIQRVSISTPANGLMVYDTESSSFWFWNGSEWSEVGTTREWSLNGNAGTDTTTNFIGTTDDMPLDFKVNNVRGLRLVENSVYVPQSDQDVTSINVIAGHSNNTITSDVIGSNISGGGGISEEGVDFSNSISGSFSNVGGGWSNSINSEYSVISGGHYNEADGHESFIGGGAYNFTDDHGTVVGGGGLNRATASNATVPGGYNNEASGKRSFAAGTKAKAIHDGAFMWADGTLKDFNSDTTNEFAARATGGVRFVTAIDPSGNPTHTMTIDTAGTVTAEAFVGDGSGLTNLQAWNLTGNTGTVDGTHFLGTSDNVALDFRINNFRAFRLQPGNNIIGGSSANSITNGAIQATIAGGGESTHSNTITASGGTISGGRKNTVSGLFGTVPGGEYNTASGSSSFAAGNSAFAGHAGTFVWADNTGTTFQSTGVKQFLIRATNGVGINKNNPSTALDVNGTVTATAFIGNGSGLTNLWNVTGNGGTDTTSNFIGTTDNMSLDFRVNNQRSLRITPAATSSNITGGYSGNFIADGVDGAVIAGGGSTSAQHNSITADFGVVSGGIKNTVSGSLSTVSGGSFNTASGNLSFTGGGFNSTSSGICSTVGGGEGNTASGNHSTVLGGKYNEANGDYSIASGRRAKIDAAHDGTFLFADQNNFDFNSDDANEFAVRATGGIRFVTAIDGAGNPTKTVRIDGSGALHFQDGTKQTTASGVYTVANGDFVPRSDGEAVSTSFSNGLGGTYISTSGSTVKLIAPVHLPQGATITAITVYGNDESATLNLKTVVHFSALQNAGAGTIISHTSSGSPGAYNSAFTPTYTIDNTVESYFVSVEVIGGGWPSTWGELAINAIVIEWEMQ